MDELKAALAEYIREARRMTLLHFDYFRKHEEFAAEPIPPKDEEVAKNDLIENDKKNDKKKDRNEVFSHEAEKKASWVSCGFHRMFYSLYPIQNAPETWHAQAQCP